MQLPLIPGRYLTFHTNAAPAGAALMTGEQLIGFGGGQQCAIFNREIRPLRRRVEPAIGPEGHSDAHRLTGSYVLWRDKLARNRHGRLTGQRGNQ